MSNEPTLLDAAKAIVAAWDSTEMIYLEEIKHLRAAINREEQSAPQEWAIRGCLSEAQKRHFAAIIQRHARFDAQQKGTA